MEKFLWYQDLIFEANFGSKYLSDIPEQAQFDY